MSWKDILKMPAKYDDEYVLAEDIPNEEWVKRKRDTKHYSGHFTKYHEYIVVAGIEISEYGRVKKNGKLLVPKLLAGGFGSSVKVDVKYYSQNTYGSAGRRDMKFHDRPSESRFIPYKLTKTIAEKLGIDYVPITREDMGTQVSARAGRARSSKRSMHDKMIDELNLPIDATWKVIARNVSNKYGLDMPRENIYDTYDSLEDWADSKKSEQEERERQQMLRQERQEALRVKQEKDREEELSRKQKEEAERQKKLAPKKKRRASPSPLGRRG
jgi:hypothetical protein